jgi:hypothetical protein
LFDAAQWPGSGPRPCAELLAAARTLARTLAPADERFVVIAGVNQETVTAIEHRRDDFVYTITRHGDGTVPTVSALLPGARTYYTPAAHSELTRDARVARAVADVLRSGKTRRLPTRWQRASDAQARVSDRQLRRTQTAKVDWSALSAEARRIFLQSLNEPPALKLRLPARRAHVMHASDQRRIALGDRGRAALHDARERQSPRQDLLRIEARGGKLGLIEVALCAVAPRDGDRRGLRHQPATDSEAAKIEIRDRNRKCPFLTCGVSLEQ